jgi:c-di-GMP-binding flagellar brake protein YcgR
MSFSLLSELLTGKRNGQRRRYQRYRADFPLTATAFRETGYLVLQGRCSDVAQGGMGVILNNAVEPGEVLTVDFQLPHSPQAISIRAVVRYRVAFVLGLEFLGPSAEQQSAIRELCGSLEKC